MSAGPFSSRATAAARGVTVGKNQPTAMVRLRRISQADGGGTKLPRFVEAERFYGDIQNVFRRPESQSAATAEEESSDTRLVYPPSVPMAVEDRVRIVYNNDVYMIRQLYGEGEHASMRSAYASLLPPESKT